MPIVHDRVAQYDVKESDYYEIRKHMTFIYQHNHHKLFFQDKSPSITELVVVKENDDWFRGRVHKINRDLFTIELIDEGAGFKLDCLASQPC